MHPPVGTILGGRDAMRAPGRFIAPVRRAGNEPLSRHT